MYGRHDLSWRKTRDPYAILVSEIMLQQTQVDRVKPYFERWMHVFPTVEKLARAPLSAVLREWQGLGYNRRGKMLRACAQAIVEKHKGKVPNNREELIALPAIGPYTAGAIRAFAFNEREIFIETNIRAVVIHHFFPRSHKVPDTKLIPILEKALEGVKSPREWYWALMDYGVLIKKKYPNPSRRSKHHVRQPQFKGSLREVRGAVIRRLVEGPATKLELMRMDTGGNRIETVLSALVSEGMIEKKGKTWQLAHK